MASRAGILVWVIAWLFGAAIGPAAVALPVSWAADAFAGAARRWFKLIHRTDDLSRLVRAASGTSVDLTPAEFGAVRHLLENQRTWEIVGQGTVGDLADLIAVCLPPRDGRTAEDSHAAALAIARGLIEFTVAGLDPKLFQQVLLARLQRIGNDQANALDLALLDLHTRFATVMGQIKLVLDRLPPGPADRGEVMVYLRTLIDWLNVDPWPRELGGHLLVPAEIERELRISTLRGPGFDAHELAQRCQRLVILGGPGSGKTWLAKRTARRTAEKALQALASGSDLDQIELPLYTSCSRLFGADGDIRQAIVSAALDGIGDLGGSRISLALRVFFAERNAPTVAVIDSLDEARGPSTRLRQADTLPWRVILTSRPSSWRTQLDIDEESGDESRRVGYLRPLRYPEDVEAVIRRWFDGRPEGNDLAAQLASRPGLQRGATVPLILAFYCVIGGRGPLPEFRRDLYTLVLRRLLTGRWRDDDDSRQADAGTCLRTLRSWAWAGAASDPLSGVGTWEDEIPTEQAVRMDRPDQEALDHVATPTGSPDVDTGQIARRFIHRSVQEHLVAEYVASLPADDAAQILLPHLWYDPDWENAAPAAVAMHPRRDEVLKGLIRQASCSSKIPDGIAPIDGCWELRRFVTRVAAESRETDWDTESAQIISRATVELAATDVTIMAAASRWPASAIRIRRIVLNLMDGHVGEGLLETLAKALAALEPEPGDLTRARARVLSLLEHAAASGIQPLAGALGELNPAPGDLARARTHVLSTLAGTADPGGCRVLVKTLSGLHPHADDQTAARTRVLDLLSHSNLTGFRELIEPLRGLTPTPDDLAHARTRILRLLETATTVGDTCQLAALLLGLGPEPGELAQARARILGQLDITGAGDLPALAQTLRGLHPEPDELAGARTRVLDLLNKTAGSRKISELVMALAELKAEPGGLARARARVLSQLDATAEAKNVGTLAEALSGLRPEPGDLAQARSRILQMLHTCTKSSDVRTLAAALRILEAEPADLARARPPVLSLLEAAVQARDCEVLAEALRGLRPEPADLARARSRVLSLQDKAGVKQIRGLVASLRRLDPTPDDLVHTRARVLALLHAVGGASNARILADVLVDLDPEPGDLTRARHRVLNILENNTRNLDIAALAELLGRLEPQAADMARARVTVRRLLHLTAHEFNWKLTEALADLHPTVNDLEGWTSWRTAPDSKLLAGARQFSSLQPWLETLTSLGSLPAPRPI